MQKPHIFSLNFALEIVNFRLKNFILKTYSMRLIFIQLVHFHLDKHFYPFLDSGSFISQFLYVKLRCNFVQVFSSKIAQTLSKFMKSRNFVYRSYRICIQYPRTFLKTMHILASLQQTREKGGANFDFGQKLFKNNLNGMPERYEGEILKNTAYIQNCIVDKSTYFRNEQKRLKNQLSKKN